MSDDILVVALNRARKHVGPEVWDKLSEHVQSTAIDEELRVLEAEGAATTVPSPGH